MNEEYLVDFCPPGFSFGKKVNRIRYSHDKKYWREKATVISGGEYCGVVKGQWQQFEFYDGTMSLVYPVPLEEQLYNLYKKSP